MSFHAPFLLAVIGNSTSLQLQLLVILLQPLQLVRVVPNSVLFEETTVSATLQCAGGALLHLSAQPRLALDSLKGASQPLIQKVIIGPADITINEYK